MTGDIFSASIESLALGGDGLGSYQGKRVFIPFTAPGDTVSARITEEHESWARAELTGILEASPDRVSPQCPHYGKCGGCSLQHLSYSAQLRIKKQLLAEALIRPGEAPHKKAAPPDFTAPGVPAIEVIPSKSGDTPADTPATDTITDTTPGPWQYRNRVSLHAIRANRGPRSGFKVNRSEKIIPLEDCPAADPAIRSVLPKLRPPPGKDRFTLYGRNGIVLAEEGSSGPDPLPSRGTTVLLNRNIQLEASVFFQSNAAGLESLIPRLRCIAERAAAMAGKTQTAGKPPPAGKMPPGPLMADMYAGVGTFSLFLADFFPGGVDLLEENQKAISLAKINLEGKNTRFRFFPQRDEVWAKRGLSSYAFAVADPPRQGLSPSLVRELCRRGPPVLAYVSCEVSSFVRDYRLLTESYKLEELILFDFYPHTAHSECMGTFIRKC
ncbi:putative RNA methyltransferase [Spirochaetia bacterium]|nr:putative RNA methyltransferase [Spirochaetia bacterium]